MATFTRQQILERFTQVERTNCGIREEFVGLPCVLQRPNEPETEDSVVDFEAIQKLLEEQNKKNKEYHDKKYNKFNKGFEKKK